MLRDDDLTAVARPQPGLSDLKALVEETRGAGTQVEELERMTKQEQLPDSLGRTAYRIVQEGLTNARKHAPGLPVGLLLDGRPGDHLLVELTNPVGPVSSAGSAAALNGSGTGTGLIGLAERVRLTGGEIDHGVVPDGQFRLCARLPWPAVTTAPAIPATSADPDTPADPGTSADPAGPS